MKKRTPSGDAFQRYVGPLWQHPILSKEAELELIARCQTGDRSAMNDLTRHNIRLLVSTASQWFRYYRLPSASLEDFFNVAYIGFEKAVEKFDVSKECRLATYAGWWMRTLLDRYVADCCQSIRVPDGAKKLRKEVDAAIAKLDADGNDAPDFKGIACELKLTPERAEVIANRQVHFHVASLDMPRAVHDGTDGDTLHDSIPDECGDDVDRENADVAERINAIIASIRAKVLTPRMDRIITMRFTHDLSLEQCADELALSEGKRVTRERIRQIEAIALEKLEKAMRKSAELRALRSQ